MNPVAIASRRAFVRLLGIVPAALPAAVTQFAGVVGKAEVAAALIPPPALPAMPGEERLGKVLATQVRDIHNQLDQENYAASTVRVDGLDPDLVALRSTSRAWKVLKMAERHRERQAMQWRLSKLLWG